MPFISPLDQPPASSLPEKDSDQVTSPHKNIEDVRFKTVLTHEMPQPQSEKTDCLGDGVGRIPRVRLDVEVITDMVAAKLATSLLGHVLFLKSQVPFPVMQLARIPGGQKNSRAAKLKRELLESFDTLSSHLDTTFTALSTALARCSKFKSTSDSRERGPLGPNATSQAYMAILVGPSIGSAKSKVLFAVDGLEVKVWGTRDDQQLPRTAAGDHGDETDEEEKDESESDEEAEEERTEDSDEVDEEASEPEDSDASEPEESDEEPDSDEEGECSSQPSSPPPAPPKLPSSRPTLIPVHSHAQEQQVIRTADRLLSRTLAAADADGNGMAAELAPTQTHILLRAPRRFKHPAWIPRQNVTKSMDGTLNEFLCEAGFSSALNVDGEHNDRFSQSKLKSSLKRGQKNQVEGVWVAGKTLMQAVPEPLGSDESEEEEDEMIWWSWDGKIAGFSDW